MSRPHLLPAGHRLPSTATGDQAIPRHESRHPSPGYAPVQISCSLNRPYPNGTPIHLLDQDSLLHILYFCRPVLLDEDVIDDAGILKGGVWTRERWWYKLAQVCRRWRYLILDSSHHLDLSLVCSRGTPVAEMLEHSPPLPIIIDYIDDPNSITTEDEEGILLALKHRDRVRRIRFRISVPNMEKIVMALEDEFPMLEFLYIVPPRKLNTSLILPKSFRVPDLHHLVLRDFAFPIGSPLLSTATCLITLWLEWNSPSVYFHPNDLVHRLSQMPQLETLSIAFRSPVSNRHGKSELLRGPLMTHVTLPNLRWFRFAGASDYLEALLSCMTAHLLARLEVLFIDQLIFYLPHLRQFLDTAGNLRFSSATLLFRKEWFSALVFPNPEARMHTLYMSVACRYIDWQVASAAQIFSVLRPAFSAVEDLTFRHGRDGVSERHNEDDRTQWRDLLRSFGDVKAFRVTSELVGQLSHSLHFEDGESPVELLPELKELSYPNRREFDDVFTPFIDARRIAGRPVTVVHR